MTPENVELENALVNQKDALRHAISHADDARDLEATVVTLNLLVPVWNAVGYGYKIPEIRALIRDRAESMKKSEEEYLAPLRKNAATRVSTERHIRHLIEIIGMVS